MNGIAITEDERTWAILAHLSALLSVFSAFLLGPLAALVIWLVKKEQSSYVGFQALQSLIYQLFAGVLNWVMWGMIILLSAVLIGCLFIPVGMLVSLATVGYPVYAAYRCAQGDNFRYFLVADLIAPRPAAATTETTAMTPPPPPTPPTTN